MHLDSASIARPSLALATALVAAALGVLMTLGGAALALALATSPQPPLQTITAVGLTLVGVINLLCSFGIRQMRAKALLASAIASMALILYLGVGLRDFGEPFWLHAVLLAMLLASSGQARVNNSRHPTVDR